MQYIRLFDVPGLLTQDIVDSLINKVALSGGNKYHRIKKD